MDETKVQIGNDVLLDIGTHSDWYINVIYYDNESVNVELRRKTDRNNKWWIAEQIENCSEKTNNCETCRFELYCPEMCEGCCEWDSHYEPKDESQTERIITEQLTAQPHTGWIKREDAIKAVDICVQDGWYRISPLEAKQNIRDLISEKDEPTEITYQNCSDALLKMWMDNVLTDAEYNRIMDKLNKANRKDEPQPITDYKQTKDYCDSCNHKGCEHCVSDSRNPYCIPSNYELQMERNE